MPSGCTTPAAGYPLRGLLTAAPTLGWELDLLDARTSGDTAGSRDRVVGYAAFVGWAADGADGSQAGPPVAAAACADRPAGSRVRWTGTE